MTGAEIIQLAINLAIMASSLAVLTGLILKGSLAGRTLALGPTRNPGFSSALFAGGALLSVVYVVLVFVSRESTSPALAMLASLFPFAVIGLALGRCNGVLGGFRIVGLLPRHPKRDLVWGATGTLVALLFSWTVGLIAIQISTHLGLRVEPIGHDALVDLIEHFSVANLVLIIISAVVMAPLIEELVFRGVMQTSVLHVFGMSRWTAMLYTAVLFSITHAWVVPWQSLLTLFVLGLVFGYLYERTGSLLAPILAHAGFNAMNIAIALTLPQNLQ
eukprot:g13465.t1